MSESNDVVEAGLIARVRDGEPTARAVYADWLEERGHLDRAMLLRGENPVSTIVELFSWLHVLGELDGMGAIQIAPRCVAFGVGSGIPIPPSTGAAMVTRPQVHPVRPTHLVVPESIADRFVITNVRVGCRSQFQTPAPLPASVFTPASIAGHGCRISFDTVNAAQDFAVEVENTGGGDCVFFAVVFCLVEPAAHLAVESWPGAERVLHAAGATGVLLPHDLRGETSPDGVSVIIARIDRMRSAVESARADATAGRADAYPPSVGPIIDESEP